MGHWHIDPETHHATSAPGAVGECCEPFATYDEVFGPDRTTNGGDDAAHR